MRHWTPSHTPGDMVTLGSWKALSASFPREGTEGSSPGKPAPGLELGGVGLLRQRGPACGPRFAQRVPGRQHGTARGLIHARGNCHLEHGLHAVRKSSCLPTWGTGAMRPRTEGGHAEERQVLQLDCQLSAVPGGTRLTPRGTEGPISHRVVRNNKPMCVKPLSFGVTCYTSARNRNVRSPPTAAAPHRLKSVHL